MVKKVQYYALATDMGRLVLTEKEYKNARERYFKYNPKGKARRRELRK